MVRETKNTAYEYTSTRRVSWLRTCVALSTTPSIESRRTDSGAAGSPCGPVRRGATEVKRADESAQLGGIRAGARGHSVDAAGEHLAAEERQQRGGGGVEPDGLAVDVDGVRRDLQSEGAVGCDELSD